MNYKIFDIGGSYIKIYDSKTKEIIRIKNDEQPIIPLNFIKNIIINNITDTTDYIGLSSQMHGFILFDENYNKMTDFITWKKTTENNILNEPTFYNFCSTGLKKRNDLPINNLYEFLNKNKLSKKRIFFKNITEGILDESFNITHETMACGHGFYDITLKKYIDTYIDYFNKKFNIELRFDNVIQNKQISGFINYKTKKIPVYVGLGDLQSSIYSFNFKNNFLLINMATGSQIVSIVNSVDTNDKLSYRPFFNKYLKCITHIPSGRFLNIYAIFFENLNINFWDYINCLTLNDLYESTLHIETNIFCDEGINISKIKNNFNIKNLISSILYHYVKQYINLINCNNFDYDFILLSGGIGKKIKLIKIMIEKELKKNVILNDTDDDSIHGVIKFLQD